MFWPSRFSTPARHMKKLFCTLALLMAVTSIFARADTFEVGRKTIIVPVPQGFFRVAEDHMAALKSFTDSFVDPANDTLAYYILESDVPAAMAGEIPLLDRYFILKVNKQVRNLTVGKNDFAEFKKLIREQNKALLEGVTSRARESLRKTGENITQEFAINLAVELTDIPHIRS